MKKTWLITIFILFPIAGSGQTERKFIREGNRAFEKETYDQSEVAYRKALEENQESYKAGFNLGGAIYKQERYPEAAEQFQKVISPESSKLDRSKIFHNIGNAHLNAEQLTQSIEAYKEALRNNPGDMETKYNLSYAMNKLQEQQQEQQNQQQQPGSGEEEQENQQEEQQVENREEQPENQPQNEQESKDNPDQENRQPTDKISREAAERLLQALATDEKEVMEKVQKQKAAGKKITSEKEW